jgi:hypothetical protein
MKQHSIVCDIFCLYADAVDRHGERVHAYSLRAPMTISKTDLGLLLAALSLLVSLGLSAYAVVALVAFLLGRVSQV